jgi:hypothetical protein
VKALVVAAALLATTPAALADPPKRPVPEYNGRESEPTTVGDVVRTVGKVVLFPVRIVVDYGIRWPIGKLISTAEHSRGFRAAIRYAFLLPPAPTMSIFPIAFYDFGFQSSIGVRFLWTWGFLTPGSKFSLKLGTGGPDWWRADGQVIVAAPERWGSRFRVGIDTQLRRRPDQQFFGIGYKTPHAARARYLQARFAATGFLGWPELSFTFGSVAHFAGESHFRDSLSIDDQVAAGRIDAAPPGYRDLVVTQRYGMQLALDTRGTKDSPERDRDSSGARIDGLLERVRDREVGEWMHLDATVGGALRLDRAGEHKLDLRMRVELVEPTTATDPDEIPFLELASIGGTRDLRGFASGRGRDLSAAAVMLDYQWPLAAWLDATLYLGAGNVFGRGLSGFQTGKLRGSYGMGLAIAGLAPDRQLELWAAVGSEPFDEGGSISSFRLVLGYSHDY